LSTTAFQISITEELEVTKDRVRNLIGDAHWGEEGRYKEEILKSTIRKFLPSNVSVGTGFIKTEYDISKQIDLIIYDNTQPLLFSEGDFIIITPRNVLGLIEIKSSQNLTQLRQTITKLEENIRIVEDAITTNQESASNAERRIFYGIFSFEYSTQTDTQAFKEMLKLSQGLINHISLGKNKFVRLWKQEDGSELNPAVEADNDFYNIYGIENLSYSYFISNLVHMTSGNPTDRYWFSFPLEETKEAHRENTIILQHG